MLYYLVSYLVVHYQLLSLDLVPLNFVERKMIQHLYSKIRKQSICIYITRIKMFYVYKFSLPRQPVLIYQIQN